MSVPVPWGVRGVPLCPPPPSSAPDPRRRAVTPCHPPPAAINIALDRIRREFEFNISTTHRFEVNLNASKSLSEVALDIMESVRLHMEPARRFLALFTHFTFLAMLYLYLQ